MPSFQSLLSFADFIDEVPDALLLVDSDGTVIDMNEQVVEMFGYGVEDLLGAPIELLVPEGLREEHVALREDYLDDPTRRPMGTDLILLGKRADGTTFPIQVSLAPVHAAGATYVLASVRDVTERVQFQQQASVLNRVLRHNIRNRLNVIVGNVELLAAELGDLRADLNELEPASDTSADPSLEAFFEEWKAFPADAADRLYTVQESSEQLLQLADRARQLKASADRQPTDAHHVSETVQQVLTDLTLGSREVTVTELDLADRSFPFEPELLSVVLQELLTNAVEHTETSQIRIRGRVDGGRYVLEIEDDGSGIPAVELDTLGNLQEQQLQHGMGLGLWVSKWLVNRMDGELDIDTDETGTVIAISLPLDP